MPTKYTKEVQSLKNKKIEDRTDDDWQGVWDAQALANAALIQNDSKRLERAKIWAAVLVEEEQDQAEAFQNIAVEV